MEININQLGSIIEGFEKTGYFHSDSLLEAIEQMKEDSHTTVGISIQVEELDTQEEVLFNELLQKIIDNH